MPAAITTARFRPVFGALLVGIATATAPCAVSAGTISSWSGSTSAAWSLNGNWVVPANKPTASGTYSLVYSGTPTNTTSNNNVGVVNIDSILFSNNGSVGQTSAFTVGSTLTNSITLLNGATITTTAVSGTTLQDTLSSAVTMSGTSTFSLGTDHGVRLTGSISGSGTVVKQGAGELVFTSASTITGGFGGIRIDSGAVTLQGSEKLAALNGLTVSIGGSAAGTLTLSGGASATSGTSTVNFQMGNDATIQLTNSPSLNTRFSAADFNVANAAVTTGKTLSFTGGGSGNQQSVTVDGVIRDNSANGGIVDVAFGGKNIYVLNAASTYTGSTSVVSSVLVNGTLASPTVTVSSTAGIGGYLGGSGLISGTLSVFSGGSFAPGGTASGSTLTDSVATFTVGSLALNSGATTALSVTGTSPGILNGFDQVAFTGGSTSLTYGGLLDLALSGSYANYTTFDLFSGFTSQVGDFTSIALSALGTPYQGLTFSGPTGGVWETNKNGSGQSLKFDQSTGTLAVVPEPSAWVIATIGTSLFSLSRWRQRAARRVRVA